MRCVVQNRIYLVAHTQLTHNFSLEKKMLKIMLKSRFHLSFMHNVKLYFRHSKPRILRP